MPKSSGHHDLQAEEPPDWRVHMAKCVPFRVCCGRHAWQVLEKLNLSGANGESAPDFEIEVIRAGSKPPAGPAILVLDAKDLHGADRALLLESAQAALPGRPVVIGGCDDRRTLLEAINEWRAVRLLPQASPPDALVDAIHRAHEMLALDVDLERCAHDLLVRCHRLATTVEELKATQERLLHAERLATVGRTIGALMKRMQEQSRRLEVFRAALVDATAAEDAPAEASARLSELMVNLTEAQRCFDALVADMLALAEVRPAALICEPEDLDALMERTVRLFRYDPLGQERHIHVDCCSKATVLADRNRLRHAILNLLRNAAQATTPADHIRVRVRARSGMAVVEIEDTGEGMSPETLDRIFTPFFTTKGSNGMGLGLRLTRATIEGHHGTLDCTTAIGQGSTFRIRLPIMG